MGKLFILTHPIPPHSWLLEILEESLKRGEVGLALLQDAVLTVRENHSLADRLRSLGKKGVKIYPLKEDLDARGIPLDALIQEVSPIDYKGLVDLIMEKYDGVVSWG